MKRVALRVAALPLLVAMGLTGPGAIVATAATIDSAAASGFSGAKQRAAGRPPLVVPQLGIGGAAIIPVGIDAGGHLAVGPSVRSVYTWSHGVRPGQPGSAVLAGHTWSQGAGVFDQLATLRRGDRFSVGRSDFAVTRVRRVRSLGAGEVRDLFSDRGRARVVLITCGDRSAATGVYATRILVYANKV